jgi:Cu/Ag efflux protein CusF
MSKLLFIPLFCVAFALPTMAQPKADDHAAHHTAAGASAPADMTAGEIRKVDKAARQITIKHAEIRNLEMPPMTMVFQVRDARVLDKVKAGDKVSFLAEKTATGALMVTDIQPAK